MFPRSIEAWPWVKLILVCLACSVSITIYLHLQHQEENQDIQDYFHNADYGDLDGWDTYSAKESRPDQTLLLHKTGGIKKIADKNVSSHLQDVNLTEYHLALSQPKKLLTANRLIYNRVPKCGSITLWNLIIRMKLRIHFRALASKIYDPPWLSEEEQHWLVTHLSDIKKPFIYNRHLCFLDFQKFGYQMPVYINLVRNPVDRFVSSYYYQRDLNRNKLTKAEYNVDVNECLKRNFSHCTLTGTFMLIPFFCGHGEECLQRTRSALTKAKENAAQYYGAVGLLEDFESFLKLLGCVMPQYFDGIAQLYKGRKINATKNKGAKLTDTNRKRLSEHMKLELEFYYFLKDRFYFLEDRLNTQCHF